MTRTRDQMATRTAVVLILGLAAILYAGLVQAQTALPPDQQASAAADAAKRSAQAAAKSAEGAASSALAAATSASAASSPAGTRQPPATAMVYGVPIIVFLAALTAIAAIKRSLPATWSLAEALSEEVFITPLKDASGATILDKDGKPVLLPEMKASSSRVIALMGMVALLVMYVGFGVFALYSFGVDGKLDNKMDGVISFLAAGMTLFAPYAVNKAASMFQGLTGK
jgi:hypothetical protein